MAKFNGFKEEYFETTDGTNWRGREIITTDEKGHKHRRKNDASLGVEIAETLREKTNKSYQSWTPARYLAIHWAIEGYYISGAKNSARMAKLAVDLNWNEIPFTFGFYLEKPEDESIDKKHDLLHFVDKVKGCPEYVKIIRKAMDKYNLEMKLFSSEGILWTGKKDFKPQEIVLNIREVCKDKSQWMGLWICRSISERQEVIKQGHGIVYQMIEVFEVLLPVYEGIIIKRQ